MRSKADETFVVVETLICPLQIPHLTHNLWPNIADLQQQSISKITGLTKVL